MTNENLTKKEGFDFANKVLKYLKKKVDEWKSETKIGFSLCGTYCKKVCTYFAKKDEEQFGKVINTNSYTPANKVEKDLEISMTDKLNIEEKLQENLTGELFSYIDVVNEMKSEEEIKELLKKNF